MAATNRSREAVALAELVEALLPLALLPLTAIMETGPDSRVLWSLNDVAITVGDVKHARKLLRDLGRIE
jgi:hypothetical protein